MKPQNGLGSTDWETFKSDLRRLTADAKDRATLFENICKRFVDLPEIVLVWVGLIEMEKKTVIPIFEAGSCGRYLDHNIFTFDDGIYGAGPTGRAIKTGLPAVMNNVEEDPTYGPWREKARAYGFSSSAALPLWASGKLGGVLNIYSNQPAAFDDKVQEHLVEITRLIAECATRLS